MTRRPITRQLALLMRDVRGRFVRVRTTLTELARTVRPRTPRTSREPVAALQLALF